MSNDQVDPNDSQETILYWAEHPANPDRVWNEQDLDLHLTPSKCDDVSTQGSDTESSETSSEEEESSSGSDCYTDPDLVPDDCDLLDPDLEENITAIQRCL